MLSRLAPVAAVLMALALGLGAWFCLGRPVALPDVPGGRLNCVSFTPWEAGQDPLLGPDYRVDPQRTEAALTALRPLTNCIRLYSALGPYQDVVAMADRLGMKVMLGMWIGGEAEQNDLEIAAALELAAAHPNAVRMLVVGNEVLLRREMSGNRLADIIRSVKARTTIPVSYADIQHFWLKNPVVAEAVDVMAVHVLPYWDDPTPVSIDAVQAHVQKIIAKVKAAFPGKPVMLGEIGWPSEGRTRGEAVPTVVNEARFVREFAAWAATEGLDYNLIEGWDQPWKRAPEGTVGGFWGVLDRDMAPKFPLAGPVSEWPNWRGAALFTVAVSLVVLGLAARRPPKSAAGWLVLGVLGPALGILLVALWRMMGSVPLGLPGQVGVAWLIGLTLTAAAVIALMTGRDADARLAAIVPPYRWATLTTATFLALGLGLDGRHRDYPTVGLLLPAIALTLHAWMRHTPKPVEGRREAAWIAITLALAGIMGIDWPRDTEALIWAAVCLLLAAPWLPLTRFEFRRLRRRIFQTDQA